MIAQNRRGLSESQFRDMHEMLRTLTAEERQILAEPGFITGDEADVIVSMRRNSRKLYSLDHVLRENGISPRKRQKA